MRSVLSGMQRESIHIYIYILRARYSRIATETFKRRGDVARRMFDGCCCERYREREWEVLVEFLCEIRWESLKSRD